MYNDLVACRCCRVCVCARVFGNRPKAEVRFLRIYYHVTFCNGSPNKRPAVRGTLNAPKCRLRNFEWPKREEETKKNINLTRNETRIRKLMICMSFNSQCLTFEHALAHRAEPCRFQPRHRKRRREKGILEIVRALIFIFRSECN